MATPPFLPDETKPGASDLISLFPTAEQSFRDIIESWLLIEHNTSGTHKQMTLDDIATPTIAAAKVGIWHETGVMKTRYAAGTVFDVLTTETGLALAGGTLTGALVLSGDATASLNPMSKQQTDTALALKAALAGATFTGTVDLTDVVVTTSGVVTSGTTIALALTGENKKTLALDHDTTITVSAEVADQVVELWITQGSTGGTAAWVGVDKWVTGAAPTLSVTTGEIDLIILSAAPDGTSVYGQFAGTYS